MEVLPLNSTSAISVLGATTQPEIFQAITNCLEQFNRIVAHVKAIEPETTSLTSLRTMWSNYYLGEFAHFDALLRSNIQAGQEDYGNLLPISISHHNLQRLFEVLHREVGDRPLGTTRAPERIRDLQEVCVRLAQLLEKTSHLGTEK